MFSCKSKRCPSLPHNAIANLIVQSRMDCSDSCQNKTCEDEIPIAMGTDHDREIRPPSSVIVEKSDFLKSQFCPKLWTTTQSPQLAELATNLSSVEPKGNHLIQYLFSSLLWLIGLLLFTLLPSRPTAFLFTQLKHSPPQLYSTLLPSPPSLLYWWKKQASLLYHLIKLFRTSFNLNIQT